MKDVGKQVNRLAHAHKKQLKNLLRAKEAWGFENLPLIMVWDKEMTISRSFN